VLLGNGAGRGGVAAEERLLVRAEARSEVALAFETRREPQEVVRAHEHVVLWPPPSVPPGWHAQSSSSESAALLAAATVPRPARGVASSPSRSLGKIVYLLGRYRSVRSGAPWVRAGGAASRGRIHDSRQAGVCAFELSWQRGEPAKPCSAPSGKL
jgi:hypothetical protein